MTTAVTGLLKLWHVLLRQMAIPQNLNFIRYYYYHIIIIIITTCLPAYFSFFI